MIYTLLFVKYYIINKRFCDTYVKYYHVKICNDN